MAFARHCEPSPSAQALAHEARRVVAESARRCFGKAAQVEAFGSQATGLALPGGDLDLVVLGVTGHVQLGGYQVREVVVVVVHAACSVDAIVDVSCRFANHNKSL